MGSAEEELSRCIIQLLFKEPFYGHLLSGVVREVNSDVPTAAVGVKNGQIRLLVNENFFLRELPTLSNRVAVVKHEALHLLFKHVFRLDLSNFDSRLFNIAADLVVNQFIGTWELPGSAVTLQTFPDAGLEEDQTVEWYYEKLWALLKSDPADQGVESRVALEKLYDQESHSDHSLWGASGNAVQGELQSAETQLERQIIQARDRTSRKDWGSIPGNIHALVDAMLERRKPEINWRKAIRIFAGNSRRTYIKTCSIRRSKRYKDNPGYRIKRHQKLAVAVDTSGSVNDTELSAFFSEIHGIWRQGADVTVIECDADIQRVYEYQGQLPSSVGGRGGTAFDPVIDFLRDNRLVRYDGCIYLTDGFASAPQKTAPCKFLWVITADGDKENLEFGRVVQLPK